MQVKRQFVDGQPDHLKILHSPALGGRQHFTPRLIEKGAVEGWLSFGAGKITIKTVPDEADLVFKILRAPGVYCCFDEAKLEGSEREAREYVLDNFASGKGGVELQVLDGEGNVVRSGNVKSPDANNPAGYRQDNFYACERVS